MFTILLVYIISDTICKQLVAATVVPKIKIFYLNLFRLVAGYELKVARLLMFC
jgi:hypothetical protein